MFQSFCCGLIQPPALSLRTMKVLFLILFAIVQIFGQSYSLSGIVHEVYSQSPLPDIEVCITDYLDTNYTIAVLSNENGAFELALTIVSIDELIKPDGFGLGQNYPQPFNPSTTIPFSVIEVGDYSLQAFDILGREVASVNQVLDPGPYAVRFKAASAGLYFIRLVGLGVQDVIKVTALDGSRESRFFSSSSNHKTSQNSIHKSTIDNPRNFWVEIFGENVQPYSETISLEEGANLRDFEVTLSDYDPFFIGNPGDISFNEGETGQLDLTPLYI
jgi:hypothetical protein